MTFDVLAGGFRYNDLLKARLVSSRSDLHRKQREYGFPLPIKTGHRSAWWPATWVQAWVEERAALCDVAAEGIAADVVKKELPPVAVEKANPEPGQAGARQHGRLDQRSTSRSYRPKRRQSKLAGAGADG
jgi:predicted DNA-binding transcriptional regulator AlpA